MSTTQGAGADGLDELFQPNYEAKRRRGFTIFMFVIIGLIVLLAIVAVIAEIVVRHYAEGVAEKQIETSLPKSTTGHFDVRIHGFSVILQALSGKLDDVTVSSDDLVTSTVPLSFTADLTQVPLKSGGTTGPVDAVFTLDQDALNKSAVLAKQSASVRLGKGTIGYDSSIDLLGFPIDYKFTAKPTMETDGKTLVLTPAGAVITSGNASVDVSALLSYLKQNPVKVCVAGSLPKNTTVRAIGITRSEVRLTLHNSGLPLSASGLETKGTCS